MSLATNIKKLRLEANMTQAKLAELIGVTRATVTQWETGWSQPRMGAVEKLANVFGVSMSALVSDNPAAYRAPNALDVVAMPMVRVPLLGYVHAGKPETAEEYEYESIEIPEFLLDSDPNCYALKAEGDCMDKVYPEGCTIVVSPNKEPVNGSVAVVRINGTDTVMRRMYRTPCTLVLSPDSYNPEHTDIVITSDSNTTVEFLGKVVWFQSREEME